MGAFNAVPVTVEVVQAGNFEAGFSYTGSIMPYQQAVVYPSVAGQLTNYSVYPGDRVEAGQVLAELPAMVNAATDAARQAEWDFHNSVLSMKEAVRAQFGPDSNAAQAIGYEKKSERKHPRRTVRTKAWQGQHVYDYLAEVGLE